MGQILHIKNMVCDRCIKVVGEELEKLGLEVLQVDLGKVKLEKEIQPEQLQSIKNLLLKNGFELIVGKNSQLIEQIKTLIIQLIHRDRSNTLNINYSQYLAENIGKDYSYLSNLFSSVENITIEKYIILQKIERVKELLVYDEQTLSEIAYLLGYSSVQHLSSQFKKVTGLTPSHFKKIKNLKRKPLDQL